MSSRNSASAPNPVEIIRMEALTQPLHLVSLLETVWCFGDIRFGYGYSHCRDGRRREEAHYSGDDVGELHIGALLFVVETLRLGDFEEEEDADNEEPECNHVVEFLWTAEGSKLISKSTGTSHGFGMRVMDVKLLAARISTLPRTITSTRRMRVGAYTEFLQ
jgi:hypothetical protein